MSRRVLTLAAVVAAVAAAGAGDARAQSSPLNVGDAAPPITVSKWVKGEKVEKFDPEKTYVVEFWATWCGPCKTSIPHLTELQKKYGEKVTFVGVSVFEQEPKGVGPFVEEMGDKMGYRVAADEVPAGSDPQDGKMAQAWMIAAEEDGIPTAFVVKGGKVAWIGHPMTLDGPLEKVVDGSWNLAEAASKRGTAKAAMRLMKETGEKIQKLGQNAPPADVLDVFDKAAALNADFARMSSAIRYRLLIQTRRNDDAAAVVDKLVDTATEDDANTLNEIAWFVVDPERPGKPPRAQLNQALKAAKKAVDLTKSENGAILDTLAKAYFDSGEITKAVDAQEKAVKLLGDGQPDAVDRLEQYRKAAKADNP